MDNQIKPVVVSINKAREQGVEDTLILGEIKNQNPEKNVFFQKAEERGASATEILDEIINQNTAQKEEEEPKGAPLVSVESSFQGENDDSSFESSSTESQEPRPQEGTKEGRAEILLDFVKSLSGEKKKKGLIIGGVTLFCIFLISFIFFARTPAVGDVSEREIDEFELLPAEIAKLTEPAIVKIGHILEGDITVPPFDVDMEKLEVVQRPEEESLTFPVDNYWEGTGFIIDHHGTILTNAHVVTIEGIKERIFREEVEAVLAEQLIEADLTEEELIFLKEKWEGAEDDSNQDQISLREKNKRMFFNGATFDTKSKIKLFDPSSEKNDLSDLLEDGFDIDIIYANKDYVYDQKDFAVIGINEAHLPAYLPAVSLGDAELVRVEEPVYTFGFPGMRSILDFMKDEGNDVGPLSVPDAKVSEGYLSPSFMSGSVTSLEESADRTFHFIESDVEVSLGSSGSPMLNSQGKAVGVVSFMADYFESDDMLARSMPINLVEEAGDFSEELSGNYYYHFKKGIYFMRHRRCKRALEEFETVIENTNETFFPEEKMDSFIKRCNDLIEAGDSIDIKWDLFKQRFF